VWCRIFPPQAIFIDPSSGTISFAITNTTVASNGNFGIIYSLPNGSTAAATGVIDHVVESGSSDGLDFVLTTTSSINVAISNSNFNGNTRTGITLADNGSSAFGVSIDNTHTTNNNTGIDAMGAVTVLLSRSVISFNNIGVSNGTSPNLFFSYQDNRIDGNNTDISAPLNNSRALRDKKLGKAAPAAHNDFARAVAFALAKSTSRWPSCQACRGRY
jgi:hypothetical protein